MFYQLPPVGNSVSMVQRPGGAAVLQDYFLPREARFFASGTAALAAAVMASIQLRHSDSPEVILPAYGCPDLVSAVLHAGARPVLVDLERERPWMNIEQVSACINSHTVAIIAVSLFGIPERMDALGTVAGKAGIVLIEDSAQAFPQHKDSDDWRGDLVVLSFGRGKPVSLLGGGAVLFRDSRFAGLLPADEPHHEHTSRGALTFRVQTALYNLLLSPRLYWLPQGLPFLHLGETHFTPLHAIEPMDRARQALLPANIAAYQQRSHSVQDALTHLVSGLTAGGADIIDLASVCQLPSSGTLLRYPLLLNRATRDTTFNSLRQRGLGPSCMYPVVLPDIDGLEALFADAGEFPAAREFAARILTLPVSARVRDADLARMQACLDASCPSSANR